MREISAGDAHELMLKEPDYIYLDVRSIPEFEQGHPVKAVNIPLLHFTPGMGMLPNDESTRVVKANLPKNAKLVVGCKTGMRSARACEILTELGYANVTNVRGGFIGVMDNFGRVVEPGWSLLNLPVCNVCSEECQYEHLAAKTNK